MLHETTQEGNHISSNLALIKATEKMVELLKANGEKDTEKYVPLHAKEAMEEEKLRS